MWPHPEYREPWAQRVPQHQEPSRQEHQARPEPEEQRPARWLPAPPARWGQAGQRGQPQMRPHPVQQGHPERSASQRPGPGVFNPDIITPANLIATLSSKYNIKDILIENPPIEEIIAKIYGEFNI